MLTALQNKTKLKYSLSLGNQTLYKTDSEGNIIYKIVGGEKIPQVIGHGMAYSDPIDFMGNITFSSGEVEAETYGIAVGDYDSKLLMRKGEIPIDETSLIFAESTPTYENGTIKETSADFRVVKVAPSLNFITYLLKRITK